MKPNQLFKWAKLIVALLALAFGASHFFNITLFQSGGQSASEIHNTLFFSDSPRSLKNFEAGQLAEELRSVNCDPRTAIVVATDDGEASGLQSQLENVLILTPCSYTKMKILDPLVQGVLIESRANELSDFQKKIKLILEINGITVGVRTNAVQDRVLIGPKN